MPPNANDLAPPEQVKVVNVPKEPAKPAKTPEEISSSNAGLKAVRSLSTMVTHILAGAITGVSLAYAFRNGIPMNNTCQHIILCVIGFQFLMAEAILCLAPDSWCSTLSLKHKRWVHTWLQIIGSILAIAGCLHKSIDKSTNFNTLHGKTALVAMIFTTISLVNGVASLYAYELRKYIPGILSKLTHICFGTVAFVMASVSLVYGFDKYNFRNHITDKFTDALIVMTGIFTTIAVINPLLTFYAKCKGVIKK